MGNTRGWPHPKPPTRSPLVAAQLSPHLHQTSPSRSPEALRETRRMRSTCIQFTQPPNWLMTWMILIGLRIYIGCYNPKPLHGLVNLHVQTVQTVGLHVQTVASCKSSNGSTSTHQDSWCTGIEPGAMEPLIGLLKGAPPGKQTGRTRMLGSSLLASQLHWGKPKHAKP